MIGLRSASGFGPRKRVLWTFVRQLLPRKWRWFYEGHPQIPGQLWFAERRLLYRAVRKYKPLHCYEIGTWKGGGSTLFVAQALYENGRGILHTIEQNEGLFRESKENYELFMHSLLPYVEFSLGDYREIFPGVLRSANAVDFLLLDGAEDAQETLDQYEFFVAHMHKGCILAVHDWYTEKARLVRLHIRDAGDWELLKVLGPPSSVGLALAKKM